MFLVVKGYTEREGYNLYVVTIQQGSKDCPAKTEQSDSKSVVLSTDKAPKKSNSKSTKDTKSVFNRLKFLFSTLL